MNVSTGGTRDDKGGGPRNFEEIFKLHHRRVYSLCLRMTGNVAEAEDLTQDVFVLVFRKIGMFRGESSFTTWLHRLTVNQVLMHFRRSRARREQTTEDGELPVRPIKGSEEFNRRPALDRVVLDEVIARLPRGYRAVLVLHDVEGLEHREIARMLGCSSGTTKSQLHKARRKLRDLLRPSRQVGGRPVRAEDATGDARDTLFKAQRTVAPEPRLQILATRPGVHPLRPRTCEPDCG